VLEAGKATLEDLDTVEALESAPAWVKVKAKAAITAVDMEVATEEVTVEAPAGAVVPVEVEVVAPAGAEAPAALAVVAPAGAEAPVEVEVEVPAAVVAVVPAAVVAPAGAVVVVTNRRFASLILPH
jgi:hypothetical protein